MTYPEAIAYLESFINYEKIASYPYKHSMKLERMKDFLNILDNPHLNLRCIHIAGTKGKGSTCAFITYILREAGYKVGLYTSPHLSDFRERIRVLKSSASYSLDSGLKDFEGMISKKDLVRLVEGLKPAIERYNKSSRYGHLSFFEVYTALAFIYFKEKKVDFAVLETGLGGRLDATNVVNALVCAITPISYEHTRKLGSTLTEIAQEKAGIIKIPNPKSQVSNPIVICAPQPEEALRVIKDRSEQMRVRLYELNKDIFFEKTVKGFNVLGLFGEYPHLEIKLLGDHQLVNATVAVAVTEALRFYNIIIDAQAIRRGLCKTLWPGRCEVVSKQPWVVLDGAQNVASAEALKETIKRYFRYKRLILVLGISKDKDIKGICNKLYDLAEIVVLTKASNPRASEPETLAKFFNNKLIYKTETVKEAKAEAKALAQKDDLILVTGSLFVVGEFRDDKV
ncbi:MAG: bifunctional folylpolyglutamate synthase/dihydrofolate synthase [Candidatus Omnitrophica bacterium]|nr:bifunctional folylpolyglutamate synthase/dihydrofolate synthase [Candidatus Omnitrophota bacterium]